MKFSGNIVVTGANGFLGKHTIRNAVSRKWHVKAIVRRSEVAEEIKSLGAEPIVIKTLEKDFLVPVLKDCDAIIHLIGITSTQQGSFEAINVRNVQIIIDSARIANVSRVITPSGLGVDQYGKKNWASNDYFLSKKRIEEEFKRNNVPFVIFRPSYILGPGDELIPMLVKEILQGKILVVGDGEKPMQPTYVQDATTAFLNAAQGMGPNNSIYDLVGPETINMNELIQKVMKIMKELHFAVPRIKIEHIPLEKASEIMQMPKEDVDITQCDVLGDNSRTLKQLKIKLTDLNTAIRAAINAVKER